MGSNCTSIDEHSVNIGTGTYLTILHTYGTAKMQFHMHAYVQVCMVEHVYTTCVCRQLWPLVMSARIYMWNSWVQDMVQKRINTHMQPLAQKYMIV